MTAFKSTIKEGMKSSIKDGSVVVPSGPGVNDPAALVILGGNLTDGLIDVPIAGIVAKVTLKGMAQRAKGSVSAGAFVNQNGVDGSKLTIPVLRPYYDTDLVTVLYRVDTVTGTLNVHRPFPVQVAAGIIPAKTFASNIVSANGVAYFTDAGGVQGATLPTHLTGTVTPVGSTVAWTFVDRTANPAGYFQSLSGGGDPEIYVALDKPIRNSDIPGLAHFDAGFYNDGTSSSNARTLQISEVTNASDLPYKIPQVGVLHPAHLRSTGSFYGEFTFDHQAADQSEPIAFFKVRARDSAGANATAYTTVTASAIGPSTYSAGLASPGGGELEVWPFALNTSGMPTDPKCGLEFIAVPRCGLVVYNSLLHGDGADWQAETFVVDRTVWRFGASPTLFYANGDGTTGTVAPTAAGADGTVTWVAYGPDLTIKNSRNPQARHHFLNDPSNLRTVGHCYAGNGGTATGTTGVYADKATADANAGDTTKRYATWFDAEVALKAYHQIAGGGLTTHPDSGGGHIYTPAGTQTDILGASGATATRGDEWLYIHLIGTVTGAHSTAQKVPHRRFMLIGDLRWTSLVGDLSFFDAATDGTTAVGQSQYEIYAGGPGLGGKYVGFDNTSFMFGRIGLVTLVDYDCSGPMSYPPTSTSTNRYHMDYALGCKISGTAGNVSFHVANIYGCDISGSAVYLDPRSQHQPAAQFVIHRDNEFHHVGTSGVLCTYGGGTATDRPGPRWGYNRSGNLYEVKGTSASPPKVVLMGGDGSQLDITSVNNNHNTEVGERSNEGYCDNSVTPAPLRQDFNDISNVRTELNIISDFNDHTGHAEGYRCRNRWISFAVSHAQNTVYNGGHVGAPSDNAMRVPADSYWGASADGAPHPLNQFVNDQSANGAAGGRGDYHKGSAAVFATQAVKQVRKRDKFGATRASGGPTGYSAT